MVQKVAAAALCAVLVATPLLVLLAGVQNDAAPRPIWRLPPQQFLEYARRQPGRLAAYASGRSALTKVVQDTGAVIASIQGTTVHAAGAAAVSLRQLTNDFWLATREASGHSLGLSSHLLQAAHARLQLAYYQALRAPSKLPSAADVEAAIAGAAARVRAAGRGFWALVGPGGRLHPEAFLERYHGHLVIESLLAVVIAYLFFQRSFKWSARRPKPLSEEEIDQLCDEWEPEPLSKTLPNAPAHEPPVITSKTGAHVVVNGKTVLNMACTDFLGTANDSQILEDCKATVSKYGVGACGPRGFYGTIDVHLDLEEQLAAFMGREEGIIYSYDLSTIPSVLPAFANARDLIVIDEMADFTIQNGALLSRARVVSFKHNDTADLEAVLQAEIAAHEALKKPLNRRFIVCEAVSRAVGDVAPLRDIAALKHRYCFRLVVDESLAFGAMGPGGRGACEHFGLGPGDVEIICASMGNALASTGGFCVGSREVVDHQRLSGLGYCFSAALPPYLATAALGSLQVLRQRGAELVQKLQANARELAAAAAAVPGLEAVPSGADVASPVLHLRLPASDARPRAEQAALLQAVADEALRREGVLLACVRRSALDRVDAPPALRLAVTVDHRAEDLARAVTAVRRAFEAVSRRASR